jgi:hypothetical protein
MKTDATHSPDASQLITDKIASLGDWRGETLARLRDLIHEADPDIIKDWKWGTTVWARRYDLRRYYDPATAVQSYLIENVVPWKALSPVFAVAGSPPSGNVTVNL